MPVHPKLKLSKDYIIGAFYLLVALVFVVGLIGVNLSDIFSFGTADTCMGSYLRGESDVIPAIKNCPDLSEDEFVKFATMSLDKQDLPAGEKEQEKSDMVSEIHEGYAHIRATR